MKMCLSMVACVLLASSCYVNVSDKDHEERGESDLTGGVGSASVEVSPKGDMVEASGYVVSAFSVTVDGKSYGDLEDFYTQELNRLPERMKAAGFDDTYTFEFDAKVGFEDLWHNMTVYILAAGKNGYQARTYVNDQGGFKTYLPLSQSDAEYHVRANKRIGIRAKSGSDVRLFCYNFSAREKSARFTKPVNPVILDDFTTEITAYQCKPEAESGIVIPEKH